MIFLIAALAAVFGYYINFLCYITFLGILKIFKQRLVPYFVDKTYMCLFKTQISILI